ncbi:proline--tRNA ligase [Vagococcus xieshaowenii]|uniref:Proline--tRNA ligase n=1 Tax=Vagococcus xieshaowenii TaxID=2562451 RepID=A0A4Z0DCA4_9ENTE|nr:proline--tRNA ligase [Vagococcus xieshaowenii]QCA28178.1 proline--tRNA ligase [Vagococcus xieshaowenii]TFZ42531.1 proline--tRNA ligase [Vagococcus xieshaowenii]
MKQSSIFLPTLRENPSEAEILSHRLLLRAGYIRQVASGIYSYLPLAKRVMDRMNAIIHEELEQMEALEMQLPYLLPNRIVKESHRLETIEDKLFELHDRNEHSFVLSPSYEEAVLSLFTVEVTSYKKLPLILYTTQVVFIDEERPKYGLLKSREGIAQMSYSFHETEQDLLDSYQQMESMYRRILKRFGLEFRTLVSRFSDDLGADAKKFIALSDVGDQTVCFSSESDYIAQLELATSLYTPQLKRGTLAELEEIETPNIKTIKELSSFLSIAEEKVIKSILFMADEEPVLALVRGDYTVNEFKLKKLLNCKNLRAAEDQEVRQFTQTEVGYIGPVGLSDKLKIIADEYVQDIENGVVGANKTNFHFINVNLERDFSPTQFADIRIVKEGERSPDGEGTLIFTKGIEIGHIESLGSELSEQMDAQLIDRHGRTAPIQMAAYHLDISSLVAAVAEQTSDEKGLIWPKAIAPFDIHLLPIKVTDEHQWQLTVEVEELLQQAGYETLVDDRNESAGVKFNDSDLIGIPIRVTIGKKAIENVVEIKLRESGESIEVRKDELIATIDILKTSIL